MSAWTCEQVGPLIDLHAADECDGAARSVVESHLTTCPTCRESSRGARRLRGLLDQRYRESERLHRLWARLDAEPRRARPAAAWRFAAAAAVLLAAFGLSAWGGPAAPSAPGVRLAIRLSPPSARTAPMEMAVAHNFHSKAVAGPATFTLDLEGKTPAEFRRALRAASGDDLPPPPVVNLVLEIHNDGREVLPLRFRDEGAELSLDLQGPGAVSVPAPRAALAWPDPGVVRLGPGETLRLPIRRLIYGSRGSVRYAYWTEPGEYTLSIRLRLPTGNGVLARVQEVAATTSPVAVRVVGP